MPPPFDAMLLSERSLIYVEEKPRVLGFGTWGPGPAVETVGAPFRSSSFGGRRKQKQHLLRSHRSLVPPRRDGQGLSSPGRRPSKQRHLGSKSSPSITQPSSLRNDGDAGLHAHTWGTLLTEWPDARASTQLRLLDITTRNTLPPKQGVLRVLLCNRVLMHQLQHGS